MDENVIKIIAETGANAIIAIALLRGLFVAEKVVYRLLDTIDRMCKPCDDE